MTLWINSSNPCDTGVDVDSDYLGGGSDESVTEARSDAVNPTEVTTDEAHNENDSWRDAEAYEFQSGFDTETGMRTTFSTNDADDSRKARRLWKVHWGKNVTVMKDDVKDNPKYFTDGEKNYLYHLRTTNFTLKGRKDTTKLNDRKALMDTLLDNLDLPTKLRRYVISIVRNEPPNYKTAGWNRHYHGFKGRFVGYTGALLFTDVESAVEGCSDLIDDIGLSTDEARSAIEYASRRIDERGVATVC